jgi:hypothetical protein
MKMVITVTARRHVNTHERVRYYCEQKVNRSDLSDLQEQKAKEPIKKKKKRGERGKLQDEKMDRTVRYSWQ